MPRITQVVYSLLALVVYPVVAPADLPPSIGLRLLGSGFAAPTDIQHAGDASGRLFIVEQAGRVLVIDAGGQVQQTPFLDIEARVGSVANEQGLLGLAFHPDFENNGELFVNYTDLQGDTVVSRFLLSGNPDEADPDSEEMLLAIDQPFANHNGGQIRFGPDGFLYIATGDGGGGGDPFDNAQDPGNLLGKLLRIDVDSGTPYAIPPSNPFVGVSGAQEEIWAYGLRNPWRFTFDGETGDLFTADVGQNEIEEVNLQPAASLGGENYGWRRMEGTQCFDPPVNCDDGSLTLPILEYPHFDQTGFLGCAIIGGFRYRGTRFPLLHGLYFFGDQCSGTIGIGVEGAGSWTLAEILDSSLAITTFGEDEAGEQYLADGSGDVWEIVDDRPFCELQMSQASYVEGEVVTVSVRCLVNESTTDATVRLRVGLLLPDDSQQLLVDEGQAGDFSIAAGTDTDLGPFPLHTVGPGTPLGQYTLACELIDPQTLDRLTALVAHFEIL